MRNLHLASNQLRGHIPTSIGTLTELVLLDLHENRLTGSIEPGIANLIELETVKLGQFLGGADTERRSARLSPRASVFEPPTQRPSGHDPRGDRCPRRAGGAEPVFQQPHRPGARIHSALKLYLGDNHLSGPIPPTLNELGNLTLVNFKENDLSGSLPFVAGRLASLQLLILDHNRLVGTFPEAPFASTDLRKIALSTNELTGALSPKISNLTASCWCWTTFDTTN
mmetsp:Transcript_25218/g.74118  ORF Transcript_25218/g.74118 Transcript_25218/m.74118 type:complete len:226 (+) Transcript_25218:1609-2286(+)